MNSFRLNRLFHPVSRRCFDVAIDHGFFNEFGFLTGIEDIGAAVRTVVQANPDAIQLTVGQAHHLQSLPGRLKPSLVLRLDVANVYGKKLPRRLYSQMIADPVEQALRLDAACMCVNLFQIPGEPEVGEQCVENILRLKPACERYGMPMMVEPLVFQPNEKAGGYMVDGDEKKIIPLVRQAAELGADIIKADPTDNVQLYHQVIAAAGSVEFITCVLAIRDGIVPPTRNLVNPDPELDLDYVPNEARKVSVEVCVSNNFGFGGQNDSLVVRRFVP